MNSKLENWVRVIEVMSPALRVDTFHICMLKAFGSTGLSAVLQVWTSMYLGSFCFVLCFFCELLSASQ